MGIKSGKFDHRPQSRLSYPSSSGFTLIELLVTISIAVILATVAIPSFQSFYRDNRLGSQSNDLIASLNLAKSEAIRRGVWVTVCPAASATACGTSGDWNQGWIVFANIKDGRNGRPGTWGTIDTDADATTIDDQVLSVVPALNATAVTATNFTNYISYLPNGISRGDGNLPNGTFTLCNSGKTRVITINTAGRARVSEGTC